MRLPVLLAALLVLSACSDSAEAPPDIPSEPTAVEPAAVPEEPTPPAPPDTLDLPPRRVEQVMVEGMPEETTLLLVREDEAALPFATYRADFVEYETTASGEGESYRFVLGELDSPYHATLNVFIPGADSGFDDPEAYARLLAGDGANLTPMDPESLFWAEAGYVWDAGDRAGSVRTAVRDGRRFYVTTDLQVEMGDGFGAVEVTILSEWRWLPDGTPLR